MMDDSLPSYGQATDRDYWPIIASFIRSSDLCSAALVCQKWNDIFMPLLWGNPASHFGKENDAVYVALVRFKRTLIWARSSTRELTHTLHFPPAQAEIYDGPRSEWLSDILHRLPRLQSLIVSHIPFFDHGALSSLDRLSRPDTIRGIQGTKYNLRLLDASNCINLTPQALAAALKLFPALVYLDLSGTPSARYPEVITGLAYNPALQILKLQRLWLNDEELILLGQVVGRNLRSLDIRNNRITDRGVRVLIEDCISGNSSISNGRTTPSRQIGVKLQEIFDSEQQEEFIWASLTAGFNSHLSLESTSGRGLTHLYISDNRVTAGGASGLLRCKDLRVLDVGNVLTEVAQSPPPRYELPPSRVTLPGAGKLISIIEEHAEKLCYLRINHAVITELGSLEDKKAFEMEDSSSVWPKNAVELEVIENTVYEMPDQPRAELEAEPPIYAELEGSPVASTHVVTSVNNSESSPPRISRGPEFAPEPVSAINPTLDFTGGLFSPISPLSPVRDSSTIFQTSSMNGFLSPPTPSPQAVIPTINEPSEQTPNGTLLVPAQRVHKRTYSGTLSEHDARLRYRQSQPHSILPGTLNKIRTLVLTEVPPKSNVPSTSQRLIEFIRDCAEEERWAALHASVSYSMPPGRDRRAAEKAYALSLFPLRKIVFEMAPDLPDREGTGGWRQPTDSATMLSSTLDPDCETYLSAAKDDFSFFGSEECGLPDKDTMSHIPLAAFTQKISIEPRDESMTFKETNYDVLAEVSRFRKEKKARYEDAIARGEDGHVDGYWSGIIQVVRPRR